MLLWDLGLKIVEMRLISMLHFRIISSKWCLSSWSKLPLFLECPSPLCDTPLPSVIHIHPPSPHPPLWYTSTLPLPSVIHIHPPSPPLWYTSTLPIPSVIHIHPPSPHPPSPPLWYTSTLPLPSVICWLLLLPCRQVKQSEEIAKEEAQPMVHKDYSLKQGEKIKINLVRLGGIKYCIPRLPKSLCSVMYQGFFLGRRGASTPPPLRILCPPPLEIPQKYCFRVNVLAFCSHLLQIPISNMPSQLSNCTRCDLRAPKIQNFLGGRPPQKPVFEGHRILCSPPPQNQKFHFAEFSKKSTLCTYVCNYVEMCLFLLLEEEDWA